MICFVEEPDPDYGRDLELESEAICHDTHGHCMHCVDYDELPTQVGLKVRMYCCVCLHRSIEIIR